MSRQFDHIGKTYNATRAADFRITGRLAELTGIAGGARLLDIGAGTGNYSNALAGFGAEVWALEPSPIMRSQAQAHPGVHWVAATAEALPFSSGYFDAAIMVLCLHHLSDWHRAIREALRVSASGPLVIFAFDTEHDRDFWLFDYFPGLLEIDQRWQPSLNQLCEYVEQELGGSAERFEFPLPNNLVDHFASADWARPEAYLDQTFRSGISSFLRLDAAALEQGVERLQQELQTGKWDARYGQLRQLEELDRGYSFIRIRLTSRA